MEKPIAMSFLDMINSQTQKLDRGFLILLPSLQIFWTLSLVIILD